MGVAFPFRRIESWPYPRARRLPFQSQQPFGDITTYERKRAISFVVNFIARIVTQAIVICGIVTDESIRQYHCGAQIASLRSDPDIQNRAKTRCR